MNSFAIKMATIIKEGEKKHKQLMLRHIKENKEEISVTIKEDYVSTIKIVE